MGLKDRIMEKPLGLESFSLFLALQKNQLNSKLSLGLPVSRLHGVNASCLLIYIKLFNNKLKLFYNFNKKLKGKKNILYF